MSRPRTAGTLVVPVVVAAMAIACCAALPILAGALAGVALASALGVGGGVLALIAATAATVMVVRARRRRARPPSTRRKVP
jgi:hypothetical protein